MSIQAMFSAVSGMQADNSWMSQIGNNIANDNTIGFKANRVVFEDLFSQTLQGAAGSDSGANLGGINATQIGLGTRIGAVDMLFTQGSLQNTANPTDLAISGNGFFILKSGSTTTYSRAGDFSFDNNGNLVNPNGHIAQGWNAFENIVTAAIGGPPPTQDVIQADSIKLDTSNPSAITNINIPPKNLIIAQQTTLVNVAGNLDGNTPPNATMVPGPSTVFTAGGTSLLTVQTGAMVPPNPFAGVIPDAATSQTVYDSLGNPRQLTTWFIEDGRVAGAGGSSPLWAWYTFDTTGGAAPSNANVVGGSHLIPVVPVPNGIPPVPATAAAYSDIEFNADGSMANNGGLPTTAANSAQTDPVVALQPIPVNAVGVSLTDGAMKSFNFTLHFGTGNTWATAGANQYGNLVFQNPTTGQFMWGLRDGMTGDVTGSFQVVNGVNTYVPNSTPYVKSQNGLRDGTLQSVSVDQLGNVIGAFSNGANIKIARVALATFANPQGLLKAGNSEFKASVNSGLAIVGSSGQYDLGGIVSNALESSNVDLANELTNMIIAQRDFEANSRMITTADTLLNTLINLGK